jgi:hypothetical protein
MVALSSSRRQQAKSIVPKQITVEGLAECRGGMSPSDAYEAGGSRRGIPGVEVFRDGQDEISQVRIGRWRVLTAGLQRRVAEVRELCCERVAVKLERFADVGSKPTSEIWQLYDREGRLEAALQSTPDGRFAILSNYVTHQACRLVRANSGEMQTVEQWTI